MGNISVTDSRHICHILCHICWLSNSHSAVQLTAKAVHLILKDRHRLNYEAYMSELKGGEEFVGSSTFGAYKRLYKALQIHEDISWDELFSAPEFQATPFSLGAVDKVVTKLVNRKKKRSFLYYFPTNQQ